MTNEAIDQTEADLSRHQGVRELAGLSDLRFPKPLRRPKNETKARKDRSKHQERELARCYERSGFAKAKRVPGSGALAGLPADVDPGEWFLAEAKETRTGKLTLNPEWIRKIAAQAKQMGRPWWAVHCWVGQETGPYSKVVILDHDHFFELMRLFQDAQA